MSKHHAIRALFAILTLLIIFLPVARILSQLMQPDDVYLSMRNISMWYAVIVVGLATGYELQRSATSRYALVYPALLFAAQFLIPQTLALTAPSRIYLLMRRYIATLDFDLIQLAYQPITFAFGTVLLLHSIGNIVRNYPPDERMRFAKASLGILFFSMPAFILRGAVPFLLAPTVIIIILCLWQPRTLADTALLAALPVLPFLVHAAWIARRAYEFYEPMAEAVIFMVHMMVFVVCCVVSFFVQIRNAGILKLR